MTNIFVGNLSYQTTQDELHGLFAQYGNVERVNIVTDRETGQPRGFAFVEMTDAREAETAISQLNGMEVKGRAMNVNEARPKPAGGGGGRGFGGGGGGGGIVAAAVAAAIAGKFGILVEREERIQWLKYIFKKARP
ncbi:MAG: RNA-binding protein [Acidobacteriota bacterium]